MTAQNDNSNIERLQLHALEQRNELHRSVALFKSQLTQIRHDLEPDVIVRDNFRAASIVAALLCGVCGYVFGGVFTR